MHVKQPGLLPVVIGVALLFLVSFDKRAEAQRIDLLKNSDGASVGLQYFVDAKGNPITRKGWTNKEGVLQHTKGGGNLFFQSEVGDFELRFDFMTVAGGNSGIKYRVAKYGNSWLGCEYQVQDDKDRLFNKHSTGSLYAVYEPSKSKKQNPPGEWNRARIVVRGSQIQHWLNDVLVVEASVGTDEWKERVANSKFKPRTGFGENSIGRIMIQDHGTAVSYRNMVLTYGAEFERQLEWDSEIVVSSGCCVQRVLGQCGPVIGPVRKLRWRCR